MSKVKIKHQRFIFSMKTFDSTLKKKHCLLIKINFYLNKLDDYLCKLENMSVDAYLVPQIDEVLDITDIRLMYS